MSEALSYWQTTSVDINLADRLPSHTDVAVIGGGLMGAAACYWLTKAGISTTLIERNSIAYGATGRNGGFVVAGPAEPYHNAIAHLGHETAHTILTLTQENQSLLRQVLQEEEIECEYREPGTIRLALTGKQRDNLHTEVEALQADNFPITMIDRKQIQELIKTPISSEIIGGQFLPGQGLVHSARLVQGLILASRRRNLQMCQAEAYELAAEDGHVLIKTSKGSLRAEKVIVAINAWVSKLLPQFTNIVLPIREQMLAYEPIEPVFTCGITSDVNTCEYWRQASDGSILIGGCSSAVPDEENVGTWDITPTPLVQNAIEQVLPRLFPQLNHLSVKQRWAGLLDYTTDSCPIVDQVPDLLNTYAIAGFSGHGMPFGMKFGQLLLETIQTGVMPSILKPFGIDRPTLKKWNEV